VNVIPFTTSRLIREDTIGPDRDPAEWYNENIAGQRLGDNWTYDPGMTPRMPIAQIGSRAAYYTCAGSKGWRKAFLELVDQVSEEWGCRGLMFDQSMAGGLCFNPRHDHRPGETATLLSNVLAETRAMFQQEFGEHGVLSGEAQWDAATEWMDFTWDWLCLAEEEYMAPFHMAFPRARQCLKCTDYIPQINRIFIAGYWLDLYLEDGGARLRDYPALTRRLASLAEFKSKFSRFFNRRDAYLYTLAARCRNDAQVWVRGHRSGDEVLVMVADARGEAKTVNVELNIEELLHTRRGPLTVWSRTLECLTTLDARGIVEIELAIPRDDFLGLHLCPAASGAIPGRSGSGQ